MKRIIFFVTIILVSCNREKNTNTSSNLGMFFKDSLSIRKTIFNNELRSENGMTRVNELEFIQDSIMSKEKISFTKKASENKELFKVEFFRKGSDSIVLDSYKIGRDSILRIQTRIKNGAFIRNIHAILFTNFENYFLRIHEIMEIANKNNLIDKKSNLFYGYEYGNDINW